MQEAEKLRMRLQCPMPKLNFDKITLGHGSGGLLTHQLLNSSIFKLFSNPLLDQQHDGASFQLSGTLAMSTDSFVISPLFFPGGNIGELAVNGTVNDLAMCGARPRYLSLGLILEEGLAMDDLWEVLLAIKWATDQAEVQVITGDTKVVERGKADGLYLHTTGIGEVLSAAKIDINRIAPGDQILLSGSLATHGMAIMSQREGLQFETSLESDTRSIHSMSLKLIEEHESAIKFMRDPTRGGLATVLVEIAQQAQLGISLEEKQLPVDEQVKSACELLGLDPIFVANEGLMVAIVSPSVADAALDTMRKFPYGQTAAIIGRVLDTYPGKVWMHSEIGGKRMVNMMPGEQLPRIC